MQEIQRAVIGCDKKLFSNLRKYVILKEDRQRTDKTQKRCRKELSHGKL
jgi:hypothetical protein